MSGWQWKQRLKMTTWKFFPFFRKEIFPTIFSAFQFICLQIYKHARHKWLYFYGTQKIPFLWYKIIYSAISERLRKYLHEGHEGSNYGKIFTGIGKIWYINFYHTWHKCRLASGFGQNINRMYSCLTDSKEKFSFTRHFDFD